MPSETRTQNPAKDNGHAQPTVPTATASATAVPLPPDVAAAVDHVHEQFRQLREQLSGVIVGQDEVSEQLLVAAVVPRPLYSAGHAGTCQNHAGLDDGIAD
ncbi:MAG: hypothetical protein R3C49_18990 [Planctomycetaceae bacterium]